MTSPVQLYVYDLSNGLARQLSGQLLGRQVDGIWHTSIVVFGREIFYGRGIITTAPGQSHHGQPMQVLDMGETALDEETFREYLAEMRLHYTADKVPLILIDYHLQAHLALLDFNCNSFTNDCVGFLTGNSIPEWIRDLPADFLSTPFGAALRPTIDSMFRGPVPSATPTPPPPPPPRAVQPSSQPPTDMNPDLASALLQAVAAQAMSGSLPSTSQQPSQPTSSLSAPIHMCTNSSSFHHIMKTHKATVAFFTSDTCGPCRMIEPLFEKLAYNRSRAAGVGGGGGVAFVKVDLGVGSSSGVAQEYSVRATPTFIFFLDGKKNHELKGANQAELTSQVDLLLWEAFPPHPHTQYSMTALDKVSTEPILFTQVPNLDAALSKLVSFIDTAVEPIPSSQSVKQFLGSDVVKYLKARFPSVKDPKPAKPPTATPQLLTQWSEHSRALTNPLHPSQLFPIVDMWRLAVLDDAVSAWCLTSAGGKSDPIQIILVKALAAVSSEPAGSRNYILTTLRLLSNAFSHVPLARVLLSVSGKRLAVTSLLVTSLLHPDGLVRTAAASLAFNVAAFIQKERVEAVMEKYGPFAGPDEDGEWEVELVSAVLEALANETQSEDIVHRLTASLAFLLRFSPTYDTQLGPLLEVLQAKETVLGKLAKGGCGEDGVKNKDVRLLIQQVSEKLC